MHIVAQSIPHFRLKIALDSHAIRNLVIARCLLLAVLVLVVRALLMRAAGYAAR